jgi:hypothetical protein
MKIKKTLVIICVMFCTSPLGAQTYSDFENLSLPVDTFWNGADFSGGFNSGNAFFPNLYLYDSIYGGYWASGFAYSSMRDSVDGTYMNIYSARPAIGVDGSQTYAVGQQGSILHLTGVAVGKPVLGFYVTNSTYAGISMRDGDAFAKKFGGPTGNDPDWFKLCIRAWHNGSLKSDSVEFYLADYRFSNNTQDYIVEDWQWIDLSSLGNVDSLLFSLGSSDMGMYGMNTPPFFCMDNFIATESGQGIEMLSNIQVGIFPNPTDGLVTFHLAEGDHISELSVFDLFGKCIFFHAADDEADFTLDVSTFASGLYSVKIQGEQMLHFGKFIKN